MVIHSVVSVNEIFSWFSEWVIAARNLLWDTFSVRTSIESNCIQIIGNGIAPDSETKRLSSLSLSSFIHFSLSSFTHFRLSSFRNKVVPYSFLQKNSWYFDTLANANLFFHLLIVPNAGSEDIQATLWEQTPESCTAWRFEGSRCMKCSTGSIKK